MSINFSLLACECPFLNKGLSVRPASSLHISGCHLATCPGSRSTNASCDFCCITAFSHLMWSLGTCPTQSHLHLAIRSTGSTIFVVFLISSFSALSLKLIPSIARPIALWHVRMCCALFIVWHVTHSHTGVFENTKQKRWEFLISQNTAYRKDSIIQLRIQIRVFSGWLGHNPELSVYAWVTFVI